MPRQYRTLISQTAILPVSLTSRGRCCCEDNAIWWSNSYKRTNYLSEIFLSSQIETFYVRCSYQNVSHINGCLFLTRNSPVVEVGSLPQLRTYTFLNSFDLMFFFKLHIHNSDREIEYYGFWHFLIFAGGYASIFSIFNTLPITHPPSPIWVA